jgi:hypothetical protein
MDDRVGLAAIIRVGDSERRSVVAGILMLLVDRMVGFAGSQNQRAIGAVSEARHLVADRASSRSRRRTTAAP